MKNLVPMLLCAGLGAGATLAVVWPFGGDAALPVQAGEVPPLPSAPADARASFERLEQALAQLANKVDALDRRWASAVEQMGARTVAAGPGAGAGSLTIDEAAMQRALEGALAGATERQQRDKYDKLSDEALLAASRRLQYESKDPAAAREAIDRLLARNLGPAQRAQAEIQLGILQRNGGEAAAAEATLRHVMQSHGLASEEGGEAGYQLIWTVWKRDRSEALGLADGVARDARSEGTRLHARWTAAMLADELGDRGRARADYAAILRDCADKPLFDGVANDVRKRLAAVDGK